MWKDPYVPLPNFALLIVKGFAEFVPKDGPSVRFTTEGLMKLQERCEPWRE